MVKLILPDHLIADIQPHLPSDIDVVEVDSEKNLRKLQTLQDEHTWVR